MQFDAAKLRAIDAEVEETATLAPYHAANGLWVCLVKACRPMRRTPPGLLPAIARSRRRYRI